MRAVVRVFEAGLLALIGYNLISAAFGWRNRRPAPAGDRRRRFRVVVPAHDEEAVIGHLLSDLADQDYPASSVTVQVLADRCTDGTAEIAAGAGVGVVERTQGPDGKGPALGWYLSVRPLAADEALVVIDADNRVPPNLLARFADELDAGYQVLQAYLDVANPDESPLATASALSYWASNRMVQLSRTNLGWPADLGGTGMCIAAPALDAAGGFGSASTEDQELGVRLFLAGYPTVWMHDVRTRDEKPGTAGVAIRQRGRWARGRRQVARAHIGELLSTGTMAGFDLALRLVQPSRMGVAVGSAGLAAASVLGAPLLPWSVWAAVAALQVTAPVPFLLRDGVPARYVARYPVLAVLPLLKVPARLLPSRGWYHTPHRGGVDPTRDRGRSGP